MKGYELFSDEVETGGEEEEEGVYMWMEEGEVNNCGRRRNSEVENVWRGGRGRGE